MDDSSNTAWCSMIKKWGVISGEDIRKQNNLEQFVMINDFIAAGYGVASLNSQEYV